MIRNKFLICILIITNILFASGCISDDQEDKIDYAKVFLDEYREIIEFSNLTGKDEIIFYNNYPYDIYIIESSVHGTAIVFDPSKNKNIPSNYDKIDVKKYDIKLEDVVWPKGVEIYPLGNKIFFRTAGPIIINSIDLENMNFIIDPTGSLIIPDNSFTYAYMGFVQKNEGNIFINGTLVMQYSDDLIIFKGEGQNATWSKGQAEIDADIISSYSIRNNFIAKARITNSEAIDSLEKKAKEIDIRLRNGFYYDKQGNFNYQLFKADERDYYRIAQEGNVNREEATKFLETIEVSGTPKDLITLFLDNFYIKLITFILLIYGIIEILLKILIFIKYRKMECIKKNINIYSDSKLLFRKKENP